MYVHVRTYVVPRLYNSLYECMYISKYKYVQIEDKIAFEYLRMYVRTFIRRYCPPGTTKKTPTYYSSM